MPGPSQDPSRVSRGVPLRRPVADRPAGERDQPAVRPSSSTCPAWRPRRVRACGHRPEPQMSGEACHTAAAAGRSARCADARMLDPRATGGEQKPRANRRSKERPGSLLRIIADFCNTIRQKRTPRRTQFMTGGTTFRLSSYRPHLLASAYPGRLLLFTPILGHLGNVG